MVFLLSVVFIAIIALEGPALIRNKKWRDLTVFSFLLLIGMLYSYGQALDIPLPNPTKMIMAIFEPVALIIDSLLS